MTSTANTNQRRQKHPEQETWFRWEYRDYVPNEYPPAWYPLDDPWLPNVDEHT